MESKIKVSKSRNKKEEIRLHGFPICTGIAIGKPFFFFDIEEKIPEHSVPDQEIEKEVARFYRALKSSENDLQLLQGRLGPETGGEASTILSSHLEMMRDPEMSERIVREIRKRGKNTEYVFKSVVNEYENRFRRISDDFFRERLADFQDISRRILAHLRKKERPNLAALQMRSIVFAHELSPSDTAEANPDFIEAFVTRSGSETSHVAIMARARGIPFVSNVEFPDLSQMPPTSVIVDGRSGHVILNPTKATIDCFRHERKRMKTRAKGGMKRNSIWKAETFDGHPVRLTGNVERLEEIDNFSSHGCEGIGLFRSEYLFLAQGGFPSEEEQFLAYKSLVERLDGAPAVIRAFDIGGDKFGQFQSGRNERNPYLGCRGIRYMLKERAAFKTQVRAILRSSAFGEVSLLFPMISGLTELREAKEVVEEAKRELDGRAIPFARKIPIGCMIEVPSAAIIADHLARECDFLSIGTNDLVQYLLAVDRGNTAMSYLYTPAHPSLVRIIKAVVDEAARHKTPVTICGEVAADPKFTALLIGLGVNELSIALPALPEIKSVIRRLSVIEAVDFAEKILTLSTPEEIQTALSEAYKKLM